MRESERVVVFCVPVNTV